MKLNKIINNVFTKNEFITKNKYFLIDLRNNNFLDIANTLPRIINMRKKLLDNDEKYKDYDSEELTIVKIIEDYEYLNELKSIKKKKKKKKINKLIHNITLINNCKNDYNIIIEELLELATALQKYKRKKNDEILNNIYDEIADVKIIIKQTELIFNKKMINKRYKIKLNRIKQILKNNK